MGNIHCAPRPHGENVKTFLRRKFGSISRRRRIDDLVLLAIQGDEQKFKKISAGMKWKKREIARFYEKRDAVVDEFDEDVLELETSNLGHETPSEYSDSGEYDSTSDEYEFSSDESESSSDESELTSDCETPNSLSLKMAPEPLMYSDPDNQKLFDELNEQALGQMLNLLSLSDLPQFEEYKSTSGKTKQLDRENKGIANSAREQKTKNKQNLREIKTSAGISQSREVVASLTPGLGDGEQLQTLINKFTRSTCRTDVDARPVKVNDQQIRAAKEDSKLETEYTSGGTKRRFLGKITQGLRQRQAIPSNAKANAVMPKRENVSAIGTAKEAQIPCEASADVSLVDIAEKDAMKEKRACKKQGFFRRIAAIFSRKISSPSSKSIIQVKPASLNTDYMPP